MTPANVKNPLRRRGRMRFAACLIATSLIALSGCASEETPDDAAGAPPAAGNVTVPDPLHWSGSLKAVAEPMSGTTTGCQLQQGCATHSFEVADNLSVAILLKSNNGAVTGASAMVLYGADYDMTLRDAAGRELATSTNPGDEDDLIETVLAPGKYTLDILAWHDQDGDYDLTVTFSAVAPEADAEE